MRGDKAHFRSELCELFAFVHGCSCAFRPEKDHRFADHHAVFRSAERENVHSRIRNHRFGRDAECGYGIREPRSVHMQEHIVFVCQIGQGADFTGGIERAQFGRLRDRDHFGLGVVLEPESVQARTNQFRGQFSVRSIDRQQFAARERFRCSAFVDTDVCGPRTDNGVERSGERFERKQVRSRTVEYEINIRLSAKKSLQRFRRTGRNRIVAVGEIMVAVCSRDGREDLRMNARMVVASETAHRYLVNSVALTP